MHSHRRGCWQGRIEDVESTKQSAGVQSGEHLELGPALDRQGRRQGGSKGRGVYPGSNVSYQPLQADAPPCHEWHLQSASLWNSSHNPVL